LALKKPCYTDDTQNRDLFCNAEIVSPHPGIANLEASMTIVSSAKKALFSTAVSPLGALLIAVATAAIIWGCIAGVAVLGARAAPARKAASPDLIEITRALGLTQQQAIDQLQVVQDLLASQRAETERLAGQVESLNEKLDALQKSVASSPPQTVGATSSPTAKAREDRR
jgi:uncharacterized coiled-coil protein SlyX